MCPAPFVPFAPKVEPASPDTGPGTLVRMRREGRQPATGAFRPADPAHSPTRIRIIHAPVRGAAHRHWENQNKMDKRLAGAALTAALITVVPAYAQDRDDAVVITATRLPTRTSSLLSDVSLVTREEIERSGQSTLGELLGRQHGLEFADNGGPGSIASVFIRGANPNHTLVLVDGLRVGSATTGQTALESIPLDQVERIEVLRGPASALYGSDAIGGVIQVFTRKGRGEPQFNAFAGYGRYDTRDAGAGFSGSSANASYSLQAGYRETDGFSATNDRDKQPFLYNPDRDGFREKKLSGSLAFRPAAGHELGVNFLHSDGVNQYDDGPDFDHRIDKTLSSFGAYTRNRLTSNWTSTLRAGRGTDDQTAGSGPGRTSTFRTDQDQLSWQHDVDLPVGRMLIAYERLEQKITSNFVFAVTRRTIDTWLAGWSGNLGDHGLQANLRHDRNSQFGNKTTGSIGYGYQFNPEWRAYASAGSAFRAPSFNELYFPDFGNPELKPEQARSAEIGTVWERGGQRASIVYFRNRVRELISFDPLTFTAINVNRAKLQGWTFAYGADYGDWIVDASIDLQRPRDERSGERLIRRADRKLVLAAQRIFDTWRVGGEIIAVGDRTDTDFATGATVTLGGYTLFNATAKYAFAPDWALEARAENLADKKYEKAYGFATPGRSLFVGVRYAPR